MSIRVRNLSRTYKEALEEIEYTIGDANTKWGGQRAKDGHPAPFKLMYVEMGNEDWFDRSGSYDGRFAQFYDAIKAKYPNCKSFPRSATNIPVTARPQPRAGPGGRALLPFAGRNAGPRAGLRQVLAHGQDQRYSWANGRPASARRRPTWRVALGDAAWMTGMDRNSDIVVMSCYAPLFVNVSQLHGPNRSMQWATDLIGYDA